MFSRSVKNQLRKFFLLGLFFGLFQLTTYGENIPIQSNDLLNETWGPEEMDLGYYLEFETGEKYIKRFAGPGSWMCLGKYSIKDGVLTLGRGEFQDATPREYMDCEKKKCVLLDDNKSLYRNKVLKCKPGKDQYWKKSAITKSGIESEIQGQPVISMGLRKARLKNAMKVRTKPDPQSKAYYFRKLEAPEDRDSLPAGYEIEILARTKEKARVGEFLNYWYYVEFSTGLDYCAAPLKENICISTGWIFAEWIDLKN